MGISFRRRTAATVPTPATGNVTVFVDENGRTKTKNDAGAVGSMGTTLHSELTDVGADQHHSRLHAATHATGQADPVAAADIGAATAGHAHSAYVPVPAVAPTAGQILSATAATPLTTSWVASPSGGGGGGYNTFTWQTGRYYGMASSFGSSAPAEVTYTLDANVMFFQPFWVPAAVNIDALAAGVNTAVAGSEIRFGIYTHDAATASAKNLVVESGAVSSATTGVKGILVASTALAAGWYWAAILSGHNPGVSGFTSGSIHIPQLRGATNLGGWWASSQSPWLSQTYGPLPATVTVPIGNSYGAFFFRVDVRAAA